MKKMDSVSGSNGFEQDLCLKCLFEILSFLHSSMACTKAVMPPY